MTQFTPPGKAANAEVQVSGGQRERPRGIGVSALALLALLAGSLIRDLLELRRAAASASGTRGGETFAWQAAGPELLWIAFYFGVGVLCIWHLWRGRSWARLLVLLWGFASVARALSFLSEYKFDPAALMGRPLSFFQAVLAAILLYWFNTPTVRAWYRKSSAGAGDLIAGRLRGRLCTELNFHADSGMWRLYFEHGAELTLRCPWRIVLDDNLAFATVQDGGAISVKPAAGGNFGPFAEQQPLETVPGPGHLPGEARRLLENLRVTAVRLAPRSSDLFVSFEMGIELQTWRPSGPSQSPAPLWEYSDPALTVVANEVGVQLAIVPSDAEH